MVYSFFGCLLPISSSNLVSSGNISFRWVSSLSGGFISLGCWIFRRFHLTQLPDFPGVDEAEMVVKRNETRPETVYLPAFLISRPFNGTNREIFTLVAEKMTLRGVAENAIGLR